MSSKSQRRKEKHKKKRDEKKAQIRKRHAAVQRMLVEGMPSISTGSLARHRERVLAEKPVPWDGELTEDVAIFDDLALESLASDVKEQASAVREALQLASELCGDEAMTRVGSIPRSSPYSEWRLFLRGLVAWLKQETSSASDAWQRLDFKRRPGRMALAMMCSLKVDLDSTPLPTYASSSVTSAIDWPGLLDAPLLYHAKLLRRECFERTAIRLAEAGTRVEEEAPELAVGPRKLEWLQKFSREFKDLEPELVASLQQVALQRAWTQQYSDLFDLATAAFKGPTHDPNNLLLTFHYYMRFDGAHLTKKATDSLTAYMRELKENEALAPAMRSAISSQVLLNEARIEMSPDRSDPAFMFNLFYDEQEDANTIRKFLCAAQHACPSNRDAYQEHVEWLEKKLDKHGLTQKQIEPLKREVCTVMQAWSQGLPDDIEPRLWLVDYLLEEEKTEEVKPHVDWLAASRHENPHVRSAGWKWSLLEAMRLNRQKAKAPQALKQLDEADSRWPTWLSKDWLPYLRAAVALRVGDVAGYQQQREQIWQDFPKRKDSLVDHCMMLGAAQRMQVAAAHLKPLRAPVEGLAKAAASIPWEQLIDAANFFWDLRRTKLTYPALRMHGGKFATAVRQMLDVAAGKLDVANLQFQNAVIFCADMGTFSYYGQLKLPHWFRLDSVRQFPRLIAAEVRANVQDRYRVGDAEKLLQDFRNLVNQESDPFYRHWYTTLEERLEDKIRRQSHRIGSNFFGQMFAAMQNERDDDDDVYEFDDDEFDDDE